MKFFWRSNDARKPKIWASLFALFMAIIIAPQLIAQASSGISGTITDASGGVIQNAEVILVDLDTAVKYQTKTSSVGIYSFPSLETGTYSLHVNSAGYKPLEQTGITLALNQQVRLNLTLSVGGETQTVEVNAGAAINRDNASVSTDISPTTLIQLPLVVGGAAREAADFVQIIPGTNSTGGTGTANLRINGGAAGDGEALLDGVSLQEGGESISGLIAFNDLKLTPDMVSELQIQTSNYEPQFGNANSGVISEDFRSGTDKFHGAAWEYARNTVFNAKAYTATTRSPDNQHDFGFRVEGPIAVPILTSSYSKTFFFGLFERFRIVGGSSSPSPLTLPTLAERGGDFTDQVDASGKLIPIYDPATTVIDAQGNVTRQQFMGCDGAHPNVICSTDPRLTASYANNYIKYMPSNTCASGTDCLLPGIANNYLPKPIPSSISGNDNNYLVGKIDNYLGQKEHFSFAIYHSVQPSTIYTQLPIQIDTNTYNASEHNWIIRAAFDHTFSPTLLNHFGFGYQNLVQLEGSVNAKYAGDFPTIPGVNESTTQVPEMNIAGYSQLSSANGAPVYGSGRPAYIYNDMATWVRGKHTLKIGGEYRWIESINGYSGGEAGNFNLSPGATGITAIKNSGNAFASFLLNEVDSGSVNFYSTHQTSMRQNFYTLYAGDTWKYNPKLSLNYGLRWDVDTPSFEKNDNLAFLDVNGANSAAGGLPGRVAYSGTKFGPNASYGKRYPEKQFWKSFSPRLGVAYSVDEKTVVRAGYGIFFNQAFYDGWSDGAGTTGLNQSANVTDSYNGLVPAFNISKGFVPPPGFQLPPVASYTSLNGQSIPNNLAIRAINGNNQGYTQQWNLTVERQIWKDTTGTISYVGSKGTHLHSQILPLNAIDPGYLKTIGSTALGAPLVPGAFGVNSPFPGFTSQGCNNSVAQALTQFPQYCTTKNFENENAGDSNYHSLQLSANKRFSNGLYFLVNYTWSKTLSNTDFVEESENAWHSNNYGDSISPYERKRNKSVPLDSIAQVFHAGYVYELPVGPGKLLNVTNPVLSRIVGGWQTNGIVKISGGTPLFFRDGQCGLPSQIGIGSCPVALLPGANPWLQDKHHFNPASPVLNINAFEPISNFNGNYLGSGSVTSSLHTSGYKNLDAGLVKSVPIKERFSVEIRADLFNAFNNHYFTSTGFLGGQPFTGDISSSSFGYWNNSVTDPRVMQLSGRFEF